MNRCKHCGQPTYQNEIHGSSDCIESLEGQLRRANTINEQRKTEIERLQAENSDLRQDLKIVLHEMGR